MNSRYNVLRGCGYVILIIGIGIQIIAYNIEELDDGINWVRLVGVLVMLFGTPFIIIYSKEQKETQKVNSTKRYERVEKLLGKNNLFILRWAGIVSMISGISLIILTYIFSDRIDDMFSKICVFIVIAGFFLLYFSSDHEKSLPFQFKKRKE